MEVLVKLQPECLLRAGGNGDLAGGLLRTAGGNSPGTRSILAENEVFALAQREDQLLATGVDHNQRILY